MSTVITILIAGVIFGYGFYAIKKSVADVKAGKCSGCDCSSGSCDMKK